MQQDNYKKAFLIYVLKFVIIFCFCYLGTDAVIGLAAPGGYYSEFIHNYFDYVSWLRKSLLQGSATLLSLLGYKTVTPNIYSLKIEYGRQVHIGFDCLGYGVMSFWIAFIFANNGAWTKKLKWILGGLLLIWIINVTRISVLLIAINNRWAIPLFDHHTWFNIAAYILVFILIYFFDKSAKGKISNNITSATSSLPTGK
jgi:exosortase/archaeosortase family protein